MFIEQVKSTLKTEYKSFGLSNEAIDRIASVVEKTVTEESKVADSVKAVETVTLVAKEVMKMRDGEIQKRTDLQTNFDTYKREHPETQPPTPPTPPQEDETIKQLKADIEALKQANKEKDEKVARTEKLASIRSKMKEQGSDNDNILDLVLEKAEFKAEDTVEDIATRLKTEYDAKFTKFYGDGPVPRSHSKIVPEYKGTEDDDFAETLRKEGKLPSKSE